MEMIFRAVSIEVGGEACCTFYDDPDCKSRSLFTLTDGRIDLLNNVSFDPYLLGLGNLGMANGGELMEIQESDFLVPVSVRYWVSAALSLGDHLTHEC
jgi:hypothetical protein